MAVIWRFLMIKKIVLAVLLVSAVSATGFSGTRDFSVLSETMREHLPIAAKPLYDQNRLYFHLGHLLAKPLTAAASTTNAHHLFGLYEKIVADMQIHKGISPYTAVYYGIFEYLIITDFITRSGLQHLHHDPVPDRADTGIEIYPEFEDFFAEKSRYESFLSRYAATRSQTFAYEGLVTKYATVFKDVMLNLHATMIVRAGLLDDALFLKTNAGSFFPSDRITATLTADRMDSFTVEAVTLEFGQIPETRFADLVRDNGRVTLDAVVPDFPEYHTGTLYPVLTNGWNFLSDDARVQIDIKDPFLIDPDDIAVSPYLLDVYENHMWKGTKLLQPFDFLFTGGFPDDPATEEDEAAINLAIPGDFTHLIMYLGRLGDGTPVGAEMTTTKEEKQFSIRIIKLLETVDDPFDSSSYDLPLVTVNTKKYKHVNARRLRSGDLDRLMNRSHDIYHLVMEDIYGSLDYQYQFYWSGDLKDKNIYLVDDGLAGGAACTDYWLELFEETAGICIKGARMDRSGFIEYYTSDPAGTTVTIPEFLNPFPFELHVGTLLHSFGFNVIDPEPHIFLCDHSRETGVAIPDRLFGSEDLEDIDFIPIP
jgi:hypothetical protein